MQWGGIQRLFLDCWTVCNRAVHLVSGVFVEMALIMQKICLCNKNERQPRLLCNKDCNSMDGNRHEATAQRMPSGKKQDWGDQSLFDQSDLYVIAEALIYEIFGAILSSMPSSSE